ncbi:MAG: hypothetical protein ACOYIQ_06550 [Christensenellales bacterium]|jgi:hypothetical protein
MEKEQKVQQTQINGNAKKFPPYFGIFENEVSKESPYVKKVTASCKENVRCKPYLDNYSATADHKRKPTPYHCCLTGFEIKPGTSPYAICIKCATRNKFKDTPYCKSIMEAEARFKY